MPKASPPDAQASFDTRRVRIGGLGVGQLRAALNDAGVALNEAALALLSHASFTTLPQPTQVETVALSVADLGLPQGRRIAEILAAGRTLGLQSCPLELAAHLRLQYLDQPEGHLGQPATRHRAPPGSLTVISAGCDADDDSVPQGFYLRRIDGTLWLRGYRSGPDHLWSPDDRLLFAAPA